MKKAIIPKMPNAQEIKDPFAIGVGGDDAGDQGRGDEEQKRADAPYAAPPGAGAVQGQEEEPAIQPMAGAQGHGQVLPDGSVGGVQLQRGAEGVERRAAMPLQQFQFAERLVGGDQAGIEAQGFAVGGFGGGQGASAAEGGAAHFVEPGRGWGQGPGRGRLIARASAKRRGGIEERA